MTYRMRATMTAICLMVMADVAWGQQNDVTFNVPINLIDLSPEIDAILVRCRVESTAIYPAGGYEHTRGFPVVNRRVVTTAALKVTLSTLNDPANKPATYYCQLLGRKGADQEFTSFSANAADPAFRLSPTPAPITGSFDWVQPPAPRRVAPSGRGGNP